MLWKLKGRYSFIKQMSFELAFKEQLGIFQSENMENYIAHGKRIVKGHKAKLTMENTT